jgi:septum site-determining protein MinC
LNCSHITGRQNNLRHPSIERLAATQYTACHRRNLSKITMSQTASNTFDIKSSSLDLLALILKTNDLEAVDAALGQRFPVNNGALPSEAFVLDLEALGSPDKTDLGRMLALLHSHGIRVLALRHPDPAMAKLAAAHQLIHLSDTPRPLSQQQEKPQAVTPQPARAVEIETARPVQAPPEPVRTMVIDRPVRAGQQIYAKGTSLVILSMVSAGAEVIADGDIHVYAPLRGRALAGARGNTSARIFVRSMEAELVSIAGIYRTLEQALPDSIKGKPTQIFLENERLVMTSLGE